MRPVLGLATVLLLTGCSAGNEQAIVETVVVTETAAAADAAPQPEQNGDHTADAYRGVLQNPPTYPEDRMSRFHPTGSWSYAIVEATGDHRPDMLLRIDGTEFSRVHLYSTDADGQLIRSTDYLVDGAAGAGGSRARLEASRLGAGVYQVDYVSTQREGTSTLYRLTGTSLVSVGEPTVFEALGALPDHQTITWLPSTDHSGLAALRGATPAAAPAPTSPQSGPAAGMVRFTGVVAEKSTSEMTGGEPSPNGEPESNRYYTLLLDAPQEVTASQGPWSERTETVSEISLGERSEYSDDSATWRPLVGRRVALDVDPADMGYPTDAGMPVGMLRVWDPVVSG
mgnify:FL=1